MAAVPGSIVRRSLFWSHLVCGVLAGVFILIMAATGVLLTYERQMLASAARGNHVEVPAGATPLSADALAAALGGGAAGGRGNLVFEADPAAPVSLSRGREGTTLVNPYSGAPIEDAAAGQRQFFRTVTDWHRRLGGDTDSVRALLMDWGNLLFLFIVLSGIYIWLPKVWRWRNLRGLMFFQSKYVNAKVRDFNWHHVFSVWMVIPLLLISLSGVVISFPWANRLLYAAYGEEVPQRQNAGGGGQNAGGAGRERPDAEDAPRASLETLRASAAAQVPGWQRLTLQLPVRGPQVDVVAELGSGERRPPRRTVTLDARDGSVVRVSPIQNAAATQTPAQRARSWMRFVHTGEQYGIVGQTLAGVASLAACFLVYTGFALAWRRLIRPLFRRDSRVGAASPQAQG